MPNTSRACRHPRLKNPFHCETRLYMDASERDVSTVAIDIACAILFLPTIQTLSRAGGSRDRKLDRVIETLCHDRHHGGEPALDLERQIASASMNFVRHEPRACSAAAARDGAEIVSPGWHSPPGDI